ncbi:hypothetical protein PC39_12812 [Salinisphaera sp. PC39]
MWIYSCPDIRQIQTHCPESPLCGLPGKLGTRCVFVVIGEESFGMRAQPVRQHDETGKAVL